MTSNFKWCNAGKKNEMNTLEFFLITIPMDSSISGQGCLEDPTCIKVTVSQPIYGGGCYDGHFWAFNRGINVLSYLNDKIECLDTAKNIIEKRINDIFNIQST